MDYLHPDLAANVWVNPGEVANNGIDDDNNGLVDDVNGYDLGSGDADPMTLSGTVPRGRHCWSCRKQWTWRIRCKLELGRHHMMALKIGTDHGGRDDIRGDRSNQLRGRPGRGCFKS